MDARVAGRYISEWTIHRSDFRFQSNGPPLATYLADMELPDFRVACG
jgi:hypothetical protein